VSTEKVGMETIPTWGQTSCFMKSILPQKEGSVKVLKQVERECSVTTRSVCPHVGMIFYTAYYSTGDDPTQHFSLLQLSGRRLLNEIPIGLIALRLEQA
jgi:hypothetical protein